LLNPNPPPAAGLPESCAVAFKEWAGVCEALASGRQGLILRKGGIAEGPSGFVPEHRAFWLLPTITHEAEQGLRVPSPRRETPEGAADLGAFAVIEDIEYIDDLGRLGRLEPFHVWTAETVRKRFAYRRPGLWVLGVRVHRRAEPYRVLLDAEQAGCRSWVSLKEPLPTAGLVPVLADDEAADVRRRWRSALAADPGAGRDG
jgi:hypothetical protein